MRIIAGKYKGHNLVSFKAEHIRPTTDRVKETIFNIFQFHIQDAVVLDLFSGTGNLGIEAISRGAQHVTFVDLNKKSLMILKQNLQKLKVTEPHQIHQADVLKYLKNYQGPAADIVLIDPPFTEKMGHDVMEALSASACFAEHTLISIESSSKERMEDRYGNLIRTTRKEYGDKILSIFQKGVS
jgi:16S rRNA (guanine966-N2)-methyltransferase